MLFLLLLNLWANFKIQILANRMIYVETKTQKNILNSTEMGIEPTTFHGIYINSLSCSEVNRHSTGTVTFESDFLKPNEHMVPQSRATFV